MATATTFPGLYDTHAPILLVDDDEATLMLLHEVLEQAGYSNVESTTDPCKVPELVASNHPRLVLLDVHMPRMGGLELMNRLRSSGGGPASTPFLILTADETCDIKRRALLLGARDFLTKPLDREELLRRVRNLLRVQHLQERVGQQNAHLERRHAGPLADLQAMQAALVPEVPAQLGDLAVSVAYQPADGLGAGGDFYDVFLSATGKVVTVLGDVSGHGREALAHAALTRKTLRTYLQDELEPRAALAAAAHALEYPTGSRYATVAVGVYDGEQHTLTYALAGHPPPMLIDDASGRLIHEPVLACSSPPIGWDAPTGRRQTRVSLSSGTRACFFTDGLVEARRGGKQLGREQLLQLLSALGPRARAGELLAEVRATADRIPDDMAACLLTPAHSTDELRTRVEELEVDADTLWRARTRAFLRLCSVRPAKVAETIEHARQITAGSDRALLRVVRGPGEAEVTVRSATRRQ